MTLPHRGQIVIRVRAHKNDGRRLTRLLAGPIAGALLVAGLLAASPLDQARADTAPVDPNDPATPVTVSNDALPTPQINGVAWASAMVNNTVYVGGSFTNARPDGAAAGQNTVPRSNLLAFDVTTGQLLPLRPDLQRADPCAGGVSRQDAALRRRRLHHGQRAVAQPDRRLQHRDRCADRHLRAAGQLQRARGGGDQHHGLRRWRLPGCRQCASGVPGGLQRHQRCAARLGSAGRPAAAASRPSSSTRTAPRSPWAAPSRRSTVRATPATAWAWSTPSPVPACRWPSTAIVRNGTTDGAIDTLQH